MAAAALFSAGSALAQEASPDTWLQQNSSQTRAAVQAELQQARASGLTRAWSAGYMEPVRGNELRATVRAETLRALRSGEVEAINAEAYDLAAQPVVQPTMRTAQR